jgi:hypothetical protein
MHNGEKTLLWGDKWVNDSPLAVQFPRLCHLTCQKGIIVRRIKQERCGLIRFRRALYGQTSQQWNSLKEMVDSVQMSDEVDRVKWKIGTTRKY